MVGQQSLIYSFVARGTVILAEYTEFTGNFTSIAAQCLQKLPASNNKFTYNCDGHTFNYLVENGFMVRAHDGKHEGRKRLVVVQSKSFVIFIKVVKVKFVGTGKDTHYCEGKDHFGGGPLRVKDFGLKVIPSDKQAHFTSPRKRSLICNKYKMLEALGEVGSNEAFPKSLNPTFCVPMPLLSPRRKMGNSRSRSVPPFSSFEKLLTSSKMQNVTFLGGTRQPKAQGPIEEEKGASSLNQSCSWGGPEGVEVREVFNTVVVISSVSQNNPSEALSQRCMSLESNSTQLEDFFVKETKRELGDRRFVRSVWKVRNKEWVVLQLVGLSKEWQYFGML
ncbi:putative vesicle-associated membrane protein 726 [Vitis vinifera]|uniref:Putative vesicle-associated membrane protein 726 n=1 Tax=Vitis vinifera TaxID=29760 RepID=A0A438I149_VITVI|nr:putative vesicle-associated membrane protein 726 [Vitis vinifera]